MKSQPGRPPDEAAAVDKAEVLAARKSSVPQWRHSATWAGIESVAFMIGAIVGLALREPSYLTAPNYYTGLLPLQILMATAGTIMYFLLPALVINGLILRVFLASTALQNPSWHSQAL